MNFDFSFLALVHITNDDITNAIAKLKSPKLQPKEPKLLPKEPKLEPSEEKSPKPSPARSADNDKRVRKPIPVPPPRVPSDAIPMAKKMSPAITGVVKKPLTRSPKSYQTVLPDGSIRIPLRHSSDEVDEEPEVVNIIPLGPILEQQSSVTVKSKGSVVPRPPPPAPPLPVQPPRDGPSPSKATVKSIPSNSSIASASATGPPAAPERRGSSVSSKQTSQEDGNIASTAAENGSVRAMTKERKRILFTTKIGSGSEEQIFATQLSLSKTDSLSSQLSADQGALLESPSAERTDATRQITTVQQHTVPEEEHAAVVRMRSREDKVGRETDAPDVTREKGKSEVINKNRHSMYIENIDEIMEKQKRLDAERRHAAERGADDDGKGKGELAKSQQSSGETKRADTFREQRLIGSSGSEHDSEADSKVRR